MRRKNMKRTLLTTLAAVLALGGMAWAQRNQRGAAKLEENGKTITVDYGRPTLHGRTVQEMLNQLPEGGYWRLGANSSTTFTTSGDLMFGKIKVPKGVYSLWAQKEAGGTWELVFNTQHGQWGTQHNPKLDLVKVPLKESKAADSAEEVTISLTEAGKGGAITIQWGDMELKADFD
jgi:Protein of unknown function (DUF2911)